MDRRVRMVVLFTALSVTMLLTGCADRKYAVGYDLTPAAIATGPAIDVMPFVDARPDSEHTGAGTGLLNSSTYDTMYTEPVADGISRTLASELRAAGFAAADDPNSNAQFLVSGVVHNFRAMRVPPFESFIPYVNNVTWLWTNDSIAVSLRLQVVATDRVRNFRLLEKTYDVSNDTAVWVGFMNLDSRVNTFTRKDLAELLQAGLRGIMQEIVADIRQALELKNTGAGL